MSSYSPSRTKGHRCCELCYRPITLDDERFCASCKPKAKRLNRL